MSSSLIKSWLEEKRSALLYRAMAEKEGRSTPGDLFAKLAEEAEKQACAWEELLRKEGKTLPRFAIDLRTNITLFLIRKLGPQSLRPILTAMKIRGLSIYSSSQPGHPTPQYLSDVGRSHQGISKGGSLRAAVFGVNDGLVSNAALIFGIAGASSSPSIILLSGIAGLLAGAFSMAAGEYVSMKSQREMFEYQIDLEKKELEQYPQEEAQELALIYQAKGVPPAEALHLARTLIADPSKALDTLAKEELGLNPDELGSPFKAAFFSFASFGIGAFMPLLPFLFLKNPEALWVSVLWTALMLFSIGTLLSLFTGRNALWGGLRMLLLGGLAGIATFGIGRWLGVQLG